MSESACATDYNSIMSEVVTTTSNNDNNDEADNSTDTEPNMDHTIKRLCWSVFVANFYNENVNNQLGNISSGYGRFLSCSLHHVSLIPVCGDGSPAFIRQYLQRNIGAPLLVRRTQ